MGQVIQALPAGQTLVVTADALSSGSIVRLSDASGASDPFPPIAIVASSTLSFGPFVTPRRYAINSDSGNLSYAVGPSATPPLDPVTALAVDGAIPVISGTYKLTKAGVGAYTLRAPRADEEGTIIKVVSQTANAHVVTATGLLDDGVVGGSKNAATFAAFVGASMILEAVGLKWSTLSLKAVAVA